MTLKDLVEGLGGKYSTVYKTPTGDTVRALLRPVINILAILRQIFSDDRTRVFRWLRTPRALLRSQAPLEVMLQRAHPHCGRVCVTGLARHPGPSTARYPTRGTVAKTVATALTATGAGTWILIIPVGGGRTYSLGSDGPVTAR